MFGEAGVSNARLDEIAQRAGVSKGTIYLYFPNKEELFSQAIRHALAPVSASKEPAGSGTATGQLLDTLSRQWLFLTSRTALTVSRLVSAEQWQFPALAKLYAHEVVSRFGAELSRIIRRGVDAGEFRPLDVPVAARMLTALVMQTAIWRETGGAPSLSGKASESVLGELTEFCLQAIAPIEAAFPQADGASDLRAAFNS